MSVENAILVVSAIIAGTILITGCIITFQYANKRKNKLIYLFSINWLCQALFWYLIALAHFNYSTLIMGIAFIPQTIGVPCIVVFIELISKEHVNPLKISILTIIIFFLLLFSFYPGGMIVISGYGVHNVGFLRLFQIIFLLYYVFFYFSWVFRTWREAPLDLKNLTNFLLIGSILFSIVTAAMYLLGTFLTLFNPIGFIVHSIGAIITIYVLWRNPKIIYILPFKAYRIIILDTTTGIALYKYDWSKLEPVEENIFSMVIQAVGSVLNGILKKGEVREIQMDRAVLITHHDNKYPITSVIVASKSSRSLRYGLQKFHEKFITKYGTEVLNVHDTSKFNSTSELVEEVFDFIPEYKS